MGECSGISSKGKRMRAPNYTQNEKQTLLNIMLAYKDIIENKKTDAVSVQEKKETWAKIANQFNSVSPNMVFRHVDSLRKYYEHVKEDLRKRVGNSKKEFYKTGGGTIENINTKCTDELLLSIVNTKTVYGLESQFDCDNDDIGNDNQTVLRTTLTNQLPVNNDTSENQELVENEVGNVVEVHYDINNKENQERTLSPEEPERTIDWGKVKAHDLSTPKSTILKENIGKVYSSSRTLKRRNNIARRRPTIVRTLTSSKLAEKYELLLDKKLELVECYKKEHTLRMEILEADLALKKKQLNVPLANQKDLNISLVESDLML